MKIASFLRPTPRSSALIAAGGLGALFLQKLPALFSLLASLLSGTGGEGVTVNVIKCAFFNQNEGTITNHGDMVCEQLIERLDLRTIDFSVEQYTEEINIVESTDVREETNISVREENETNLFYDLLPSYFLPPEEFLDGTDVSEGLVKQSRTIVKTVFVPQYHCSSPEGGGEPTLFIDLLKQVPSEPAPPKRSEKAGTQHCYNVSIPPNGSNWCEFETALF